MWTQFGRWATLIFFLAIPLQALAEPALDEGSDPYPLRPADTSSPRDTLRSFLSNVNGAIQAWRTDQPESEILRSLRRAADTLDLSELPARGLQVAATEKMLLLKEILDRIQLPTFDKIPGDMEVSENDGELTQWVIPDTRITITRQEKGPRKGEFLFSAETVDRLKDDYELAKHLPYKPGASIGIYEEVRYGPGTLVPHAWAAAIPDWAATVVLGQAIWKWIATALIALLAALTMWLLYLPARRWDKSHRGGRAVMRLATPAAVIGMILVALLARYLVVHAVGLFGTAFALVSYTTWGVVFLCTVWLVLLICGRLAEAVGWRLRTSGSPVDAAFVHIVFRLLSVVVLVLIVIYSAEFIGIPITPLVAGLGVGGLALALAVRPTLENIIGGLTLFADRPVRVGDFCRYGEALGTVEAVGLRSTRIRSLERTIITVPNAQFSRMHLENFGSRDSRLFMMVLQLRYETTPEQLRYVLVQLREMLLAHPMVDGDRPRVRFVAFGASSLDLEIFTYLRCVAHEVFLAVQEDILLRIADIVAEAGTGFAFPSQTAYLTRDDGLDSERAQQAEARVRAWRAEDKLPFPNLSAERRREIQDSLSYPPKGSPDRPDP